MIAADLTRELESRGAILRGHFRLSSGRHSAQFIQKFRILEDPVLVSAVAERIVAGLRERGIASPAIVVSAAVGGIVLGYEVARQLGVHAIFVEKEDGRATLRRGFALKPGEAALVVEDVVTTGLSVREVIDVVRAQGAEVVGVAVIVVREAVDFGVTTVALLELPIVSYDPAECPLCRAAEPLTEPGSRFLR